MGKAAAVETLMTMMENLDTARSIVFVAAFALDKADSDLELQCANSLRTASEMLDMVSDKLSTMRRAAESDIRLAGKNKEPDPA